jgi:hypothetical protein
MNEKIMKFVSLSKIIKKAYKLIRRDSSVTIHLLLEPRKIFDNFVSLKEPSKNPWRILK